MTNELLFDFTVDKTAKTVYITREFDAELSLVWDAFTTAKLLDQWVGQFRKIWETRFNQLDKVLSAIKKEKK